MLIFGFCGNSLLIVDVDFRFMVAIRIGSFFVFDDCLCCRRVV